MRLGVENLAQPGMVHDTPDELLPKGAWTDARNVRFRDGCAEKCKGYEQALGELSLTAMWATSTTDGSNQFWVYASSSVLYATDGTTHANVSHVSLSYVATDDLGWTGGAFHGFVLANDGTTVPQAWAPGLGNRFASLSAWPNISAKVLRPFKDFIFALRITDGGNYSPRTLRWSDKAQQGALPSSWDFTDPTNQAGITELAQTGDILVDCAPLRDSLVIYKENHTWLADYIGRPDIFSFRQIISQAGMLAENCVGVLGTSHVVLTDNDLILHDGSSVRSIADKRMRRWLFSRINPSRYKRSFITVDYRNREVYVCIPEAGVDWPNIALAWNWAEDNFHVYELGGQMTFGTHGVVISAGSTPTSFDAEDGTFDDDSGTFDDQNYNQFLTRLVWLDATRTKAYQNDTTEGYNGIPMQVYAARTGTVMTGDVNQLKRITRLYPRVTGNIGDVLQFYIGSRESASGQTRWDGPYSYTIGTDYKIDLRAPPARIVDVRVEYSGGNTFRLYGYEIEYENDGLR